MDLPYGPPLVVVNTRAGRRSQIVADALAARFAQESVIVDMNPSSSSQELTAICRDAARQRHGYVIVVGGDGTVRDAVNGFFAGMPDGEATERPVLGIVGSGTGSDFARTYGLDREVDALFHHLSGETVTNIDVGHVVARDAKREVVASHFINVAQVGFGATVTQVASRLPRRLEASRYRAAVPLALTRFRHQPMRVVLDHTEIADDLLNVIVANGQFYGAGLQVAPQALPHDGVFDVQCWQVDPRELAQAHAQLKRGSHLARDGVRQWRSSSVQVTTPRPVPVERDGDIVGFTPATFTIKPRALRLKI
jgi:diacylglycerol kinase (ATP)